MKKTLIIASVIIIVLIYIRHLQQKRKKNEEFSLLMQEVSNNGTGIVDYATKSIEKDEGYFSGADATLIYNAGCYTFFGTACYTGGDEKAVINVLKNNVKTKARLANLSEYFEKEYEMTLDKYLKEYFWLSEYNKIAQTINLLQ